MCNWDQTGPSSAQVLTTAITNHATASHQQSHPCLVSCTVYTILILNLFKFRDVFIYLSKYCHWCLCGGWLGWRVNTHKTHGQLLVLGCIHSLWSKQSNLTGIDKLLLSRGQSNADDASVGFLVRAVAQHCTCQYVYCDEVELGYSVVCR